MDKTDFNVKDMICGVSDIPLNDVGIKQAKELAEKIYEYGDVDVIIASPMIRAQMTANAVSERINVPIFTDNRLTEWNYGSYEGASLRRISASKENLAAKCVAVGSRFSNLRTEYILLLTA